MTGTPSLRPARSATKLASPNFHRHPPRAGQERGAVLDLLFRYRREIMNTADVRRRISRPGRISSRPDSPGDANEFARHYFELARDSRLRMVRQFGPYQGCKQARRTWSEKRSPRVT